MKPKEIIQKAQEIQKKGSYNNPEVLKYYYDAIRLCTSEEDEYDKLFSYYTIMYVCSHLEFEGTYSEAQRLDFNQQAIAAAQQCMELLQPVISSGAIMHFTDYGQFQEEVIRYACNALAWNRYKKATNNAELEEALQYAEQGCLYVDAPFYFYVIDTKVRILLALERKEEAYEIIRATLIKDKYFNDFQEFKENADYKEWLKNKNEGKVLNLTENEKKFLKQIEYLLENIRKRNEEAANKKEMPAMNLSKQTMLYKKVIEKYRITQLPYEKENNNVAVLKGDVFIKGDLNSQWILDQVTEMGRNGYMTLIDGNVYIEGDLIDDGISFLFISGNLQCDYIFSYDGYIEIKGNADVKYAIAGEYNDGHIEINGETQVPFVLSDDHSIDLQPVTAAIFIEHFCNERENMQIADYTNEIDYGLEDTQRLFDPKVWNDEDEFDREMFVEMLRKGENPFVQIP